MRFQWGGVTLSNKEYNKKFNSNVAGNSTHVLFEPKYFEQDPYHYSWAKKGSVLTKAVYPAIYNAAVIEQNSDIEIGTVTTIGNWSYIKRGLPVKLSSEADITNFDIILDIEAETVTMPLESKFRFLGKTAGVAGTGNATGITFDGKTTAGYLSGYMYSPHNSSAFANSNTVQSNFPTDSFQSAGVYGLTPIVKDSGVIARLDTAETVGELYFYVGETLSGTNEINAAELVSQINLLSARPYIKDIYQNGTSQYVVWSNGYCIQSGLSNGGPIKFLKKFAEPNYSISTAIINTSSTNNIQWYSASYSNKATDGMTLATQSAPQHWTVAGQLAQGEY